MGHSTHMMVETYQESGKTDLKEFLKLNWADFEWKAVFMLIELEMTGETSLWAFDMCYRANNTTRIEMLQWEIKKVKTSRY